MPNTSPIFQDGPAPHASQGRKPATTWFIILGTVVVLGIAALGISSLVSAKPQNAGAFIKNPSVATVEKKTIRDIVSVSGVLELSKKEIITSPGDGVVDTVYVQEGDQVKPGQAILQIGISDLQSQLESKELSLEKLNRQIEQSTVTYNFGRKQRAIEIDAAKRAVDDAQRELDKVKTLKDKNLASDQDLLTAQQKLQSAQDGLVKAQIAQDQAEATYQLDMKNSLADKGILEKDIQDLKDKIAAYTVRTSRGGTVYSLSVEAGGTVNNYKELAVVANPADSRAALDVPETRIGSITKGLPVTVYVGENAYPATVETIAPFATSSSSSSGSVVRVTAVFKTKPEKPTIGSSVSAEIVAGTIQGALVLPRGPYLSSGNYSTVYVISNGIAKKQTVKFGVADGSYIQVMSGLNEGDRVIISDYRDFIHLDSFPVEEGSK
ncbi:MAG TPA: HlyD family efflux transporter periplasmic adaptor subunit [Treponema sp.]|mgnify:CR=1 FL=1|nr:HlyD family efflux transporter periplasmic adaptor subunit [Treponema sp.]HPC72201.1 HlyD family efflux transporter periplasmic adaptor subunit [Treponema sp.]HRS04848.1 HlyD family efflux transporter periplasmic adaptor subunit [Treponema sp.]HRU29336.1 HlyD family efflux transporter periplasmic adaptor subunit [Treponema sp.]